MQASRRKPRHSWTVAEAKAKLSEVIANAGEHGVQVITRRGRPAAIVISPKRWSELAHQPATLAEIMAPVRGFGPVETPARQPWAAPRL